MSARYDTSPANLRSLRDRLTAAAKREGVVFGRLQQHVGILVIAQFMASVHDDRGEPMLLVKGGASVELRRGIPQSRTSKDLDTVLRGSIDTVYDRLAQAGVEGWEGFTALFTPPTAFEVPGMVADAHRFTAKLNYGGKPFVSVPIEVSPAEAANTEGHDVIASDALALVGLPGGTTVPCMTLPWQVAQKIHACTVPVEERRTNDRAHDLVDLQLLEALMVDEPLDETRAACAAVFGARAMHGWPPSLIVQPHWGPIYARALEGLADLGLAPTAKEAAERVQLLIDRINDAGAGQRARQR